MELHPLDTGLNSYQQRWSEFGALLADIQARLAALPVDTVWQIDGTSGANIGQVTLADFAFKFDRISWTLTDKTYTDLNGGVGEVLSKMDGDVWQSAHEEIRASDFDIYMQWPNREGAVYLALHETAHVTALGLRMNSMMFDMFIHHGGQSRDYANSREWTYNEAVANDVAKTVAAAIRLDCLPDPTGGFPTAIIRNNQLV